MRCFGHSCGVIFGEQVAKDGGEFVEQAGYVPSSHVNRPMVAYMLISSMGVVDDDEVRCLKKWVDVEKRSVGRNANYFTTSPSGLRRRWKMGARPDECFRFEAQLLIGEIADLVNKLFGGTEIDAPLFARTATPFSDRKSHQGLAATRRALNSYIRLSGALRSIGS